MINSRDLLRILVDAVVILFLKPHALLLILYKLFFEMRLNSKLALRKLQLEQQNLWGFNVFIFSYLFNFNFCKCCDSCLDAAALATMLERTSLLRV